jgi:hypothetical protein
MDEYKELLTDARNRRKFLTDKRKDLMKMVEEIDRQILGLNQAVEAYEFILKETPTVTSALSIDPATVGFTEAVRTIFNGTLTTLFPTDIRDKLAKAGYEKSSDKVLLIHVHNVIDRLLKNEEIEEVEIDGRSAYRNSGKGGIPTVSSFYKMDATPAPIPSAGMPVPEAPSFGGFPSEPEKVRGKK